MIDTSITRDGKTMSGAPYPRRLNSAPAGKPRSTRISRSITNPLASRSRTEETISRRMLLESIELIAIPTRSAPTIIPSRSNAVREGASHPAKTICVNMSINDDNIGTTTAMICTMDTRRNFASTRRTYTTPSGTLIQSGVCLQRAGDPLEREIYPTTPPRHPTHTPTPATRAENASRTPSRGTPPHRQRASVTTVVHPDPQSVHPHKPHTSPATDAALTCN